MSDEVTIDVGPVFCPSCKRPYVSAPTLTEEERRLRDRLHQRTMDGYEDGYAEVYVVTDDLHDALAIIDRLSGSTSTGGPGGSEAADHAAMADLRNRGVTYPSDHLTEMED